MATKKITTKKARKPAAPKAKAAKAKKAKPGAETTDNQLSQIDAAIRVLAEAKEPMNCAAMVEAMQAEGYWASPGGKTPQQTLYSSILREIANKGAESRFRKAERGKFASA